jgi:hypothetical protein
MLNRVNRYFAKPVLLPVPVPLSLLFVVLIPKIP